jgi:putative transposase
MANTYTQLYIHIIVVVKGRQNQISLENKTELYKYITGTVQNKGHKLIAVNGGFDHIHILVSLNPKQSISDLVKDIKLSSSDLINGKKWLAGKFYWQEGFAAFSVSKSNILDLIEYINNQEIHHRKKSFKEEYIGFLNKYGINFDERFIFSDN